MKLPLGDCISFLFLFNFGINALSGISSGISRSTVFTIKKILMTTNHEKHMEKPIQISIISLTGLRKHCSAGKFAFDDFNSIEVDFFFSFCRVFS